MGTCGYCGEAHTEAEGEQGSCYDCDAAMSCAEALARGNAARDGLARCDECKAKEEREHAANAKIDNHMEQAKQARVDLRDRSLLAFK